MKCRWQKLQWVTKITINAVILNFGSTYTDKATNPLNKENDWDNIRGFCDQLNNEPEGWDNDADK